MKSFTKVYITLSLETSPHESSENPFLYKKPSQNSDEDSKGDSGIHPLYPLSIDQPAKGVQVPNVKPTKKPSKTLPKTEPPLKYDFDNYDVIDEEDENDNKKRPQQNGPYGPGFFNPTLTKHPDPSYPDYDQGIYNNENFHRLPPQQQKPPNPNQFNPYILQHGDSKHELINILGGNGQNLPPHIEHILQQFQGANDGNSDGQSQPPFGINSQNGLNYPYGIQRPGLNIPNESNQNNPTKPQGKKIT